MTYLKHPTPVTSTTLTTSQRLAEQTLSLLCVLVCFTHLTMPMEHVHVHIHVCQHSLHIFTCFCAYSNLYLLFVEHRPLHLHCIWENYSSSQAFMCQSAVSQAKKALEGTIAECENNSFSFFWQFVLQGNDEALIGVAGERTKPCSQQRRMLTVLA